MTNDRASKTSVAFPLFVALNAVLFVRPSELVPALAAVPIYWVVILLCLAASPRTLVNQLSRQSLVSRPITAAVVGLLAAVVLSHLYELRAWEARLHGVTFLKVLLYYLLLVGSVDSPQRLRQFLAWLVVFAAALTALALLQYHGVINVPALAALDQFEIDKSTGEATVIPRLCSTGIFNDPNDLSLLLVAGIGLAAFLAFKPQAGASRLPWLACGAMFLYALVLTHSRGGLIAFLIGLLVLFFSRYGWRKAVLGSALVLPLVGVLFAGRQTDMDMESGTAQQRIQLWGEGLQLLRTSPVFGIGMNRYGEELGLVAHNSFVHCYVELGLLGGTLFTGAFFVAAGSLHRLRPHSDGIPDPEMRRLRPYLLAIVVAYATGLLVLSRAYVVPTYLILGLAAIYLQLLPNKQSLPLPQLSRRLVGQVFAASAGCLVVTYLFVRTMARWG
jgi:hypothetical protein